VCSHFPLFECSLRKMVIVVPPLDLPSTSCVCDPIRYCLLLSPPPATWPGHRRGGSLGASATSPLLLLLRRSIGIAHKGT
jgi:hypothetical protein